MENGSIYVWGAQGQTGPAITEEWIHRCEVTEGGAKRAVALWKKRIAQGKGDVLRAFDCSGLVMYYLQDLKGIYSQDMSSNTLKAKCQIISANELRPGDFVFRTYQSGNKKGRAYHIGVVVDNDRNVIEAKGRDDGVVKRGFDAELNRWDTCGRLEIFETEAQAGDTARLLKLAAPLMTGTDVKRLQEKLIEKGYSCGGSGADGAYGKATQSAVKLFQRDAGLAADGIAGPKTWAALETAAWSVSRVLKRTSPLLKGQDVRAVQRALLAKGYSCGNSGADGVFGRQTEQAVRAFQKAEGLTADGKVRKQTTPRLGGKWAGA